MPPRASLACTIQYYVLIDMQGFADLIDALGGIDIDGRRARAARREHYDDGSPAPPTATSRPGTAAHGRLRRRSGTRGRGTARTTTTGWRGSAQVQEAILAQFEPGNIVLTKFQAVAAAGAQVV